MMMKNNEWRKTREKENRGKSGKRLHNNDAQHNEWWSNMQE